MRVCAGRPGQRTHRLDPLASTAGRPQLPAPWQPRVFFFMGRPRARPPSLLAGFVSCRVSPMIVGEPRLTTPVSCALLGELGRCVGGRTPSSSGQLTCVTVFLAGTRGSAAGAVGAAEALRGCAGAPATTPSPVPPSTWRPPTWRTLLFTPPRGTFIRRAAARCSRRGVRRPHAWGDTPAAWTATACCLGARVTAATSGHSARSEVGAG